MKATLATAQRELQQWRSARSDRILLALPLILGLLVWWLFASGSPQSLPITVVDLDQSGHSRALVRLIDATPAVAIAHRTDNAAEAQQHLLTRYSYAVLIIPHDFSQHLNRGTGATLILQHNAQFATHSSQIVRAVRSVSTTYSAAARASLYSSQGVRPEQAIALAMPIQVEATALFNESMDYEQFLAATLIPALLQILIMVAVVSAIGRELRDGTAQQWLDHAQGQLVAAVVGKLLPYFIVFIGYGLAFLLWFAFSRGMHIEGSLAAVLLGLLLLVSASMALGVLLIALARNLRMALSLTGVYTAPAFAFAGQAYPLVAMPPAAQALASTLPLTHWLDIQNQQWLAGAPLSTAWPSLWILLFMTLVPLWLGLRLLQRSAFQQEQWGAR